MNEIDTTVREAESTMARLTEMLKEGEALLKRSEEFAAQGATPELAHEFLSKQTREMREGADREIQALNEELERDLPKREAQRTVRVRATRTMV
jgi:hypothetical protein